MNRRFKRSQRHELPSLNFFALPDILFILIFFFVLSSHVRQGNTHSGVSMPLASELQQVDKRAYVVYVTIKQDLNTHKSTIWIENKEVPLNRITAVMKVRRSALEIAERQYLVVSLRVDKDMTMGVVSDVKLALRQAKVLNICYAAMPEPD